MDNAKKRIDSISKPKIIINNPDVSVVSGETQLWSTHQLNETLKKRNPQLQLSLYVGNELQKLDNAKITKIAECYRVVFNGDWGESWTSQSAYEEVALSLSCCATRTPVAAVLENADKVIGFAWGVLMKSDDIDPIKDMPFSLPDEEKIIGADLVKYWVDKFKEDSSIFLFRELGVLKEFRNDLSAYICYPLYVISQNYKHKTIFYWTNINSPGFTLGLGMSWSPIHFFRKDDLLIMKGSTKTSLDVLGVYINNDKRQNKMRAICDNIAKYMA